MPYSPNADPKEVERIKSYVNYLLSLCDQKGNDWAAFSTALLIACCVSRAENGVSDEAIADFLEFYAGLGREEARRKREELSDQSGS